MSWAMRLSPFFLDGDFNFSSLLPLGQVRCQPHTLWSSKPEEQEAHSLPALAWP